ncbi:MAG: hypothetical protein ACM65L_18110 [Microcoleus sp.]
MKVELDGDSSRHSSVLREILWQRAIGLGVVVPDRMQAIACITSGAGCVTSSLFVVCRWGFCVAILNASNIFPGSRDWYTGGRGNYSRFASLDSTPTTRP